MPANTPQGYPYPLPTEPVAEGAQAIRNLAESLKGQRCIGEYDLQASAVIGSIPATFDHLRLIIHGRSPNAVATDPILLALNGDVGANYDRSNLLMTNGVVSASQAVAQTQLTVGVVPGASGVAGYFGVADLLICNYAIGSPKQLSGRSHCFAAAALNLTDLHTLLVGGTWRTGAPVDRFDVFTNGGAKLAAGSRAWLYGISGA